MTDHKDDLPIWLRPEPSSRKPRYTREQIARAALRIADREGFDSVSMRRIARELGAGTMTLYHYVHSKLDLVALMDDALMAEALVPADQLPTHWREAVAAIAAHTRSALLRHPWALSSLNGAQFGPNAMRHFEQYLLALSETGLQPAETFDVIAIVNNYVSGNVLQVSDTIKRMADARANPAAAQALTEFGLAQLGSGEFPHTAALAARSGPRLDPGPAAGPPVTEAELDEQFQRGLDTILDGIATRFTL